MNIFVTVIIPVYNGEKMLPQCLEALMTQTYSNYEVIIVDNSSTDSSKKIINLYVGKDKKFKYVFEPKKSRGHARNTGINNAQGKVLLFTDQDCILPKNWIASLVSSIEHDEKAVMGVSEDLIKNYWTNNVQKFEDKFLARLTNNGYIGHVDTKNFAITTKLAKELMFDGKLVSMEDFDFFLRLKEKKVAVKFLAGVAVGHHHASSFIEVVKVNIDRGFWITKIYMKHRQNLGRNEPMFSSISVINFISAPLWYTIKLVSQPWSFPYLITSDLAWRVGIIWAKLT